LNVEIIQQGNLIDKWSGSNHNNSPDNKWNKDKLHSSELKAGQQLNNLVKLKEVVAITELPVITEVVLAMETEEDFN